MAERPQLRLEWVDPKTLTPNPKNWRRHPKAQKEALSSVLGQVGWAGALLWNERTSHLIDGHLRRDVVPDGDPVPVLVGSWTEEQEALILATLDPLAAMAESDASKVQALLDGLGEQDAAVQAVLDGLAAEAGIVAEVAMVDAELQVDKAEELQEHWKVKAGDIWRMGDHAVICGDCREPETWERLLEAAGVEKVNGVFTSPPYAEQRKEQYGGVPTDKYVEWWEAVQANVRASLAADGSFFVNIKPHCEDGERVLYVFDLVLAMRRRWGWRFVDELCWTRPGLPGYWSNRFRNEFEPVYHFAQTEELKFRPREVGRQSSDVPRGKGGLAKATGGNWTLADDMPTVEGMAQPGNVIRVARRDEKSLEHAAAFPVALPAFFIKAYSDPGDIWLDPFLGSGTTVMAANQNGRRGLGIEVLEKYVSVCLERFLQATGIEPRLVESP
jgi:site-specific DNA-methyltransferase (adenine-specific)